MEKIRIEHFFVQFCYANTFGSKELYHFFHLFVMELPKAILYGAGSAPVQDRILVRHYIPVWAGLDSTKNLLK